MYYVTHIITLGRDIQSSKEDQTDWAKEKIYQTQLRPIYVKTCNNPQNST